MPRNDPTDTGGLFIGRRPGTGPVHYRTPPERGDDRRRRADGAARRGRARRSRRSSCLSRWGPQPLGWLWVGSQVDYRTDSVMLGIIVAFLGLVGSMISR